MEFLTISSLCKVDSMRACEQYAADIPPGDALCRYTKDALRARKLLGVNPEIRKTIDEVAAAQVMVADAALVQLWDSLMVAGGGPDGLMRKKLFKEVNLVLAKVSWQPVGTFATAASAFSTACAYTFLPIVILDFVCSRLCLLWSCHPSQRRVVPLVTAVLLSGCCCHGAVLLSRCCAAARRCYPLQNGT